MYMLSVMLKFHSGNLLLLLATLTLPGVLGTQDASPFLAVWNVPTRKCWQKYGIFLNFGKFGITSNDKQSFFGEEIVLIYEPRPGLYPRILQNKTMQNGGLPQNADLKHHLMKAEDDIQSLIPDNLFRGMAVIDWESWRPIFNRNLYEKPKHIYVKATEKSVRKLHPNWSEAEVKAESQKVFETAARSLMELTLKKGRQLRPTGKWGFYGFPRCFNYGKGEKSCSNDTLFDNDRLNWLFAASSALYPSIYLDTELFPTPTERKSRVHGILGESLRVHNEYMDRQSPVYAYTLFRYRDTKSFYRKVDLVNTVQQSFDAGLDGVVLWDSSMEFVNQSDCLLFNDYLENQLGPFLQSVIKFAMECSIQLCHKHGKCVNKNWKNKFVYNSQDNLHLTSSNYKCVCYYPWTGDNCTHQTLT